MSGVGHAMALGLPLSLALLARRGLMGRWGWEPSDATTGGLTLAALSVGGVGWMLGGLHRLSPWGWGTGLLLVLVSLGIWARPPSPQPRGFLEKPFPFKGLAVISLMACCLSTGVVVRIAGWAVQRGETSWDGLAYHLPMAFLAVQEGHLRADDAAWFALRDLPRGLEMFPAFLWALGGDDTFLSVAQVPFVLLGALAVMGLVRRCGGSASSGRLAGGLFPLAPVALAQVGTAYVDLTMTGFCLAGLSLVSLGTAGGTLLGGMALGYAAAGKASAVLWVLGGGGVVLLISWRGGGLKLVSIFSAGVLAVAGPSWLTRMLEHGNPLHPIEIKLLGRVMAEGVEKGEHFLRAGPRELWDLPLPLRLWKSWGDLRAEPVLYDMRPGGLGPLVPLILLAVLGVIIGLFRDRRPGLLGVASLPCLLLFPGIDIARYALPLWGLGLAALGILLGRWEIRRPGLVNGVGALALGLGALGAWDARFPFPSGSSPQDGPQGDPRVAVSFPWDGVHGERDGFLYLCRELPADARVAYTDPGNGEFVFAAPLWCGTRTRQVTWLPPQPGPSWWMALQRANPDAVLVGLDSAPDRWLEAAGAPWERGWRGVSFTVWRQGAPMKSPGPPPPSSETGPKDRPSSR